MRFFYLPFVLLGLLTPLLLAQMPVQPAPDNTLRHPAEQLYLAALDLESVPPELRRDTRYLDLGDVPTLDERRELVQVLGGHLNGLSRAPLIAAPFVIPNTQGTLLRINVQDYRLGEVYEKLAEVDYVYHQKKEQVVTVTEYETGTKKEPYYRHGPYGQVMEYREVPYKKEVIHRVKKVVTEVAPWVVPTRRHQIAYEVLTKETHSQTPIVRGWWGLNQTGIQEDRAVGYFDLLGVKDRADWEQLIGFNDKIAAASGVIRSAVSKSGVTRQPRAYVRKPTANGWGYHLSIDYNLALGQKNPLAVFGQAIEDAGEGFEAIGPLPNGMPAFGLFNGKGGLVKSAPANLANSSLAQGNDHRIHPNVSCWGCHSDGALRSYTCWVRNQIVPPLTLENLNQDVSRLAAEEYTPPLEPYWERDRLSVEHAVKKATGGMSSKEYSDALGKWFWRYELAEVDLAWASRDVGVPAEKIKAVLEYDTKLKQGDLVLNVLTLESPRINTIPIRQWEEKYPLLQTKLLGVAP